MKSRSATRKVTKESIVLRYMRISKGLSMRDAGRLFRLTGSTISHIEHGRMDLPSARVEQMVGAYGFTMEQFNEYVVDSKKVPNKFDRSVDSKQYEKSLAGREGRL